MGEQHIFQSKTLQLLIVTQIKRVLQTKSTITAKIIYVNYATAKCEMATVE